MDFEFVIYILNMVWIKVQVQRCLLLCSLERKGWFYFFVSSAFVASSFRMIESSDCFPQSQNSIISSSWALLFSRMGIRSWHTTNLCHSHSSNIDGWSIYNSVYSESGVLKAYAQRSCHAVDWWIYHPNFEYYSLMPVLQFVFLGIDWHQISPSISF